MPRITVETKEKIGQIQRIKNYIYEIPNQIHHNKDGQLMTWNSYHRAYVCLACGEFVTGNEFVLSELKKLNTIEDESEM